MSSWSSDPEDWRRLPEADEWARWTDGSEYSWPIPTGLEEAIRDTGRSEQVDATAAELVRYGEERAQVNAMRRDIKRALFKNLLRYDGASDINICVECESGIDSPNDHRAGCSVQALHRYARREEARNG